jgi:hemolysin activation/secretion protein
MEAVAGGLETVRGYPQSWVASDTLYLGRAEYRVHLPRLLPDREPIELPYYGAFRVAPDRRAGRPDWDLILRAFLDYGRAEINDASSDEQDTSTLTGTGVGAELQLPGNLILRFDYGLALNQVNGLSKYHDTFSFSFALVR